MAEAFRIGRYKVHRIEEWQGGFSPPEALFAEFEAQAFAQVADTFEPDCLREGMIYGYLQSWLIDTGDMRVLVDTGAGNGKQRPGIPIFGDLDTGFLSRLADAGYSPEDIDTVFCTHLHIDHVGWNTQLQDGEWVPTFPNATYCLPAVDDSAWNPDGDQYRTMSGAQVNANVYEDSVVPVLASGRCRLVNDGEAIGAGMTAVHAPGHTPGHMVLEVCDDGDMALFTGDILHHPMQIYRPDWNSVYCEDRAQAAETRLKVLNRAANNDARIVPAHFGAPHSVFVERLPNGRFRPEDAIRIQEG